MTFATELVKKQLQPNLVISIGSVFYSIHQVDADSTDIVGTGTGITTSRVGTIKDSKINPINIDIRNVRTTTQTLNFDLEDLNGIVTLDISNDTNQFMETEVILRVGFITGSFDLSQYRIYSVTNIKRISREPNVYRFTSAEITDRMNKNIFITQSQLNGAITDSATTLTLDDATNFLTTGRVKIDDEIIVYGGKSGNDLTSLSRGDQSSTAAAHSDDAIVFNAINTGSINPVTLMLQVIISPGGGGSFDVLTEGLGIAASDVDITSFTDIRDANFSADLYDLFFIDEGNGLKLLEEQLLSATNTRFFSKNGKIALALLDQTTFGASVTQLTEDTIVGTPRWTIGSDKIVNEIIINYDFSEGLKKFGRQIIATDSESITTFGARDSLTLNFKGIRESLSGATIATERANRLLQRLSTPRGEIIATTHFDKSDLNIGEDIEIVHRYIPAQGGGLGISEQLEILSKSIDLSRCLTTFKLQYTSRFGLRLGLIAPSPLPTSITSQSVFDVPDGTCFAVGYVLKLWDDANNVFFADAAVTITNISTNTITVSPAFVTTLNTTNTRIRFADFDLASAEQKGKYAFISPASDFFADGSKAYQIDFG